MIATAVDPPPEDFLQALRDVVGPHAFLDAAADVEPFVVEERGLWRGTCAAVVKPGSTGEVSRIVELCAAAGVPIVPQGGNTGLLGGGVPRGGIVVSLSRMNRIRNVDSLNQTLTADAGCVLADIQRVAEEAGCFFPLSLGAEGTCQIGGNLSTNAGGVNVLRYGNAREQVLGLEVVLPDGRVWDGLRGLRKDNTGYDLKQIFIGAEGTLGIITAAVLKLFPKAKVTETVMAAVADTRSALTLFALVREVCGDSLTAFELIPRIALDFGIRHIPAVADPMAEPHDVYALIEVTSARQDDSLRTGLEDVLSKALEDGILEDAVFAESESRRQDLWRIRETIPESQKNEGGSIKHDVAVPVSRVAEFVDRATALVEAALPGCRVLAFGHVGDGNIHFNISQPPKIDEQEFMKEWFKINRLTHDLAMEMEGSFSAEHGIGVLKREDLRRYKSPLEVELMERLKSALDPEYLLNPGKIL